MRKLDAQISPYKYYECLGLPPKKPELFICYDIPGGSKQPLKFQVVFEMRTIK